MPSLFTERRDREPVRWVKALNILLATALVAAFFLFSLNRIAYRLDFGFLSGYRFRLGRALLMTVYLSLGSLFASLLIGALVAFAYRSSILVLRYLARGYVKKLLDNAKVVRFLTGYYADLMAEFERLAAAEGV